MSSIIAKIIFDIKNQSRKAAEGAMEASHSPLFAPQPVNQD